MISDGVDSDEGKDEDDFFGADDDNKVGTVDGIVNQEVQRSERAGRGTTSKYKNNYEFIMNVKKAACEHPRRAIIKDGVMCFLAQDLNNAEPMVEEDQEEFALGVALTTYGPKAGIKKIGDKGLLRVKKELKQMHNLTVFIPVEAGS